MVVFSGRVNFAGIFETNFEFDCTIDLFKSLSSSGELAMPNTLSEREPFLTVVDAEDGVSENTCTSDLELG